MATYKQSRIESLGVYLPPKEVSTASIVKGCKHKIVFPLERLTGIQSRRMAGETEFSYDLAVKAVEDCFRVSQNGADDIDMVICCNISRFDGPDEYSFEPCTAARLRQSFGLTHALAFDITNACAGMFTGIYLVDAMVRAGSIRRGLVVSGEYITHLTDTAQKEIKGLVDQRVPCLTLGDAGAAVIIGPATEANCGFQDIGLYTIGKHSDLCIAKTTDQPHGGAIMTTDMINLAKLSITAFIQHAGAMAFRLGLAPDSVDHVLPHQTSKVSLGTGSREIERIVAGRAEFKEKVIDNVAHRGNTATTSHFVALKDCFLDGRIKSGESVLFGILASGITVGSALYRFDDLPDRVIQANEGRRDEPFEHPPAKTGVFVGADKGPRVRIEAVGILDEGKSRTTDTLAMLSEASRTCLGHSSHKPGEIDLLLSTGVYRTDFLMEPAIAALLAGELKINEEPKHPLEKRSLAFDVVNSGLGTLNACCLASQLVRSKALKTVMVAASEVENNAGVVDDCLRGVRETASALILDSTEDGKTGFGTFHFRHFPEYTDSLRSYGKCKALCIDNRNVARLFIEKNANLAEHLVDCIEVTVRELFETEGLSGNDIKAILPPQISREFISMLAEKLGLERNTFVDVTSKGGDLFTSSLPYCMDYLQRADRTAPGDLGLIINVASGIEVGCAVYHF